jgi:hypothetical protein
MLMDPEQPPNRDMNELEQRLLDLAKHDRIPAALSSRMAEGLGVHFAGAAVQSGLASAGHASAPWFAKTGLWGVLSIALIGGVATWYAVPSAPHAARVEQRERNVSSTPSAEDQAVAPALVATNVQVAEPQPTAVPVPVSAAAPARTRSAATTDDSALRAEVALLDRARAALHAHDGAQALRVLDQHHRRFAHGTLEPEAEALRIEALVQVGEHAQAETLSQRFVSAYPAHPLSGRVAELVR